MLHANPIPSTDNAPAARACGLPDELIASPPGLNEWIDDQPPIDDAELDRMYAAAMEQREAEHGAAFAAVERAVTAGGTARQHVAALMRIHDQTMAMLADDRPRAA